METEVKDKTENHLSGNAVADAIVNIIHDLCGCESGKLPFVTDDIEADFLRLGAMLEEKFDIIIRTDSDFYSLKTVEQIVEHVKGLIKSQPGKSLSPPKPATRELTDTECISEAGQRLVEDVLGQPEPESIPEPHDMKAAIIEEHTCAYCNFHGPSEAPLLFIVGVEVVKPKPRKRGLVLPNRMVKSEQAPQPAQQPMIMGCTCENPDSPQYQRIITFKCSCSLFMDIPKAELPEKRIISAGGEMGKKMDKSLN